tara:strand:- start:103 stop:663 length:561 start_codon:yes stop_codon:yes gene_type:complete
MSSIEDLPSCVRCEELVDNRTNVVIGEGSEFPDVVFIGEAPGRDEDIQSKPFVGRSGKLLRTFLKELDFNNYYITNLVKCRPPGNRDPTASEVKNCFPYLQLQLDKLNPKVICTLGRHSAMRLLEGRKFVISKDRGQFLDVVIGGKKYVLFPIYHPAATIYNQGLRSAFVADLKKLREYLSDVTHV